MATLVASRSFTDLNTLKFEPVETAPPSVVPDTNIYGIEFRDYTNAVTERQKQVEQFYKTNHELQTYEFVQKQKEHWLKFDKKVMSVWEAAELLNELVDDSDPDLDLPQIVHLLQTAEACRKAHPKEDWLHLTGFLHDLGKVMSHEAFGSLAQWACVGWRGRRATQRRRANKERMVTGTSMPVRR